MLSRTADNLYWMSRYLERAENLARAMEVAYRMSMLPMPGTTRTEWLSAITVSGNSKGFIEKYGEDPAAATAANTVQYLALDVSHGGSIKACFQAARENARAVRDTITTEMWENINTAWLEIRDIDDKQLARMGLQGFCDYVKDRSHMFRGITAGTMLRDDAYLFTRVGTFIERADDTARILDVKYHVILPEGERVGGGTDFYQWVALLRSVSAFRLYRHVYRDTVQPWRVAELLILNPEMPRSLTFCMNEITAHLEGLATAYGQRHECHRLAGKMTAKLRYDRIEDIFHTGLHEYLTNFINGTEVLSTTLRKNYLMIS
jgi:uncharacterized alpha-E superfamily protein